MPFPAEEGEGSAVGEHDRTAPVGEVGPDGHGALGGAVADVAAPELADDVVGLAVQQGALVALARAVGVYDVGVDLLDLFIAEAQPPEAALAHVGEEDVGFLEEPGDDLVALFGLEVDGQALLVAVVVLEIVGEAVLVLDAAEGAAVPAGVAGEPFLDLDDLGAHVGEESAAAGAVMPDGHIDHADAFQCHCHFPLLLAS